MKKVYYCVFCGIRLDRSKRKYCSNKCKCKYFYQQHPEKCNQWRKRNPPKKVNNECLTCGENCGRKRYCSETCKPIRTYLGRHLKVIDRINVRCKICNGLLFVPHVHHLNGDHKDNRKENLIILCPSCHLKLHRRKLPKNIRRSEKQIESKLNVFREYLNKEDRI